MKKLTKIVLLVVVLVLSLVLATACETLKNHEHKFATDWSSDGTSHYHACTFEGCTEKSNVTACAGGKATCQAKATCTVCGNAYGQLAGHNFNLGYATEEFLATPATHKDKATYYMSCACGLKGSDTFSAGELVAHVFEEVVKEELLAAPADCDTPAIYNVSCECGVVGTDVFQSGLALGHEYDAVVTERTCTQDGYTTYTCVREDCDSSYTDDVVPAGHDYSNGTCGACGEADPDYVPPIRGSIDFDTIVLPSNKQNGDSSYTSTYTTTAGWVIKNSAIQCGGKTDMNPQFIVIGPDNTHRAACLNGKTTAPGSITSPTLTGGISELTINYTKIFTDTKLSVTVTITDIATGEKYTHVISAELQSSEKYVVYTDVWTLDVEIEGDFTIEIVNNCPSNNTGNKDRFTILDLIWA